MSKRIDPEIAVAEMRAAGVEPLEPYPGTTKPWRSRCLTCGNEGAPRLGSIRRGSGSCRYCANARRGVAQRIDPETAAADMRSAGVEPLEPYTNVGTPWKAKCLACGNEVTPNLRNVRKGHQACVYCAGKRVDSKTATERARAAGVEPLEPYPGSKSPWRSRCLTCGEEVTPTLDSMLASKGGCWSCGVERRAKIRREDSDVAAAEMRSAGVEPIQPYEGASIPWRSRCLTCNREVAPALSSVRGGHHPCIYCSNRISGEARRIDSEVAVAEMRAAGVEPLEPYPGSSKPWRSRCLTCGDEGTPRLGNIRSGNGPCLYCVGLAPLDPDAAADQMRAAGVEPLEAYLGRNLPWRSRCLTCEREVAPRLGNVLSGSGACRYCATYGFGYDKPAVLYLFRHEGHSALKVGITNDTTDRLALHEGKGWSLVNLWFFDFGADAHAVEQTILATWDEYEYAVGAENMPQAGYTETVSLDDVSEAEALALIESLVAEHAESVSA